MCGCFDPAVFGHTTCVLALPGPKLAPPVITDDEDLIARIEQATAKLDAGKHRRLRKR